MKKIKAVLQVVEITPINQGNIKNSVTLSDGSFTSKYFVITSLDQKFTSEVKKNSIIEAKVIYDKNRKILILFDFVMIYQNVSQKIGYPIPITQDENENTQNPKGQNLIPLDLINNNQKTVKKPVKKLELEINGEKRIVNSRQIEDKFFTPIASLNIYERNFRIKGRIIRKADLREFKRKGKGHDGKGHVFNIIINDGTKAIQGTFFNEEALKYFELLEEGKIYSFADGTLKASSRYNNTKNNIEITFNSRSIVEALPDSQKIKKFYFNFVKLEEIIDIDCNKAVDIIAIVEDIGESSLISLKDGRETCKRDVVLKDPTGRIQLTVWGTLSENFDYNPEDIILLQNILVKDYKGKSLSTMKSSKMIKKIPELEEYKKLVIYKNQENPATVKSLTQDTSTKNYEMKLFTIDQMINESEIIKQGSETLQIYFTIFAYITKIPSKMFYLSCPKETCKKKVIKNNIDRYECEKCERTYEKFKPRLIANMKFCDSTGSFFGLVAGDKLCQIIFGIDEEKLYEMKICDENKFLEYCNEKIFREFKLKIFAKNNFYNGENRVKFTVSDMKSVEKFAGFYGEMLVKLLDKVDN